MNSKAKTWWHLRVGSVLLIAGTCLMLPACASDFTIFGYTTGSQFNRCLRTIRVPIFQNRTPYRAIEFQLTETVIKRIEARTPWKVVQDCNADTELLGTIVSAQKHIILQNQLNEVRDNDITLGVEVSWRDLRTGEDLTNSDANREENPPLMADPGQPGEPRPNRPILVLRTANFIPELGQSNASAWRAVYDDMADQIVSMMENPW